MIHFCSSFFVHKNACLINTKLIFQHLIKVGAKPRRKVKTISYQKMHRKLKRFAKKIESLKNYFRFPPHAQKLQLLFPTRFFPMSGNVGCPIAFTSLTISLRISDSRIGNNNRRVLKDFLIHKYENDN